MRFEVAEMKMQGTFRRAAHTKRGREGVDIGGL
jgi:hypothetical protein